MRLELFKKYYKYTDLILLELLKTVLNGRKYATNFMQIMIFIKKC